MVPAIVRLLLDRYEKRKQKSRKREETDKATRRDLRSDQQRTDANGQVMITTGILGACTHVMSGDREEKKRFKSSERGDSQQR